MCHGHAGTIVVVKIAGTDEIVAGYNPLAWDNSINNTCIETDDSLIFLSKNRNIQDSILSRVIDSSGALYYQDSEDQNSYGPCFGHNEFMMESYVSDFAQGNECWCYYDTRYVNPCYEKPFRTAK
ncbi:hypothetical protein Glove_648g11 [Diversispora epigaea]|uniref:TLDc domain-containing protein n=1 Tax=Diversispora epigaea TaxID=1348612 RepID=A0A397G4B2_9GLOM|nr:hypothetical protein Glove_648g11 [Diversispora epigaea]